VIAKFYQCAVLYRFADAIPLMRYNVALFGTVLFLILYYIYCTIFSVFYCRADEQGTVVPVES